MLTFGQTKNVIKDMAILIAANSIRDQQGFPIVNDMSVSSNLVTVCHRNLGVFEDLAEAEEFFRNPFIRRVLNDTVNWLQNWITKQFSDVITSIYQMER